MDLGAGLWQAGFVVAGIGDGQGEGIAECVKGEGRDEMSVYRGKDNCSEFAVIRCGGRLEMAEWGGK